MWNARMDELQIGIVQLEERGNKFLNLFIFYYTIQIVISQLQDCWEKYQQPQIRRWYHFNGRKWRGIKESPDEGEKPFWGEWKSW